MNKQKMIFLVILGASLAGGCGDKATPTEPSEGKFDSPRIAALWKEVKNGDAGAVERFVHNLKKKAPLVESMPVSNNNVWITYIWFGDEETSTVNMSGGLPACEFLKPLNRLANTNLWYLTESVPNDARFSYSFIINMPNSDRPSNMNELLVTLKNHPPKPDPLNSAVFDQESVVELQHAPPQPWLQKRLGMRTGRLAHSSLYSAILREERQIAIYTPAGYDQGSKPYSLLFVLDGEAYGSSEQYMSIPSYTIIDNLIASKKIQPIVAVLVDNMGKRNRDLSCSEPFADFMAKELVPWVRDRFHVSDDPSRVIICGSSAGGLCATYCGLRHPESFGNILSQSGWFAYYPGCLSHFPDYATETGWIIRRFVETRKLPLRFYLDVGKFDRGIWDNLQNNRRFRDVLEAKGYRVNYAEYNGGHGYICWRGSLADGLIALTSDSNPTN